ncbi:MAG: tetratricopeptide repeat protein, partial [Bacteroides acidifaciens]|nr:tetratricopeptide repeat protein [Bacteroides acidifaciens]
MGRKKSPSAKKELVELITNYEAAKANEQQIYLDGNQLADIANWYATERKFDEAQEVITYGLHLHPGNTDLLIEQAYLYLDTQKLQKAKKVAATITEEYEPDVKMLKAELLLNEGRLEEAQELLNSIEDADELVTLTDIVYLLLDFG